jgi:kumamolisin
LTHAIDPDERIEISVLVKPRRPLDEAETRLDRPMTREEFADSYGADPADLVRVENFAREHGLEVEEISQPRRTVRLAGRAADLAAIFGVELTRTDTQERVVSGEVQLPPELAGVVQAIFGLDTRPRARPLT